MRWVTTRNALTTSATPGSRRRTLKESTCQILSSAPPGTQPLDTADALPLSKRANDIAAETVRRHPSRLGAFATLPVADPSVAADELQRAAGRRRRGGRALELPRTLAGWKIGQALAAGCTVVLRRRSRARCPCSA